MESLTLNDDKELFLLIAEGQETAFTQLYKKYAPALASSISGLTKSECITDEIVQETFMRVWFSREKLTSISEPKNWIFRMAANVCYTFLKQLLIEDKVANIVYNEFYYGNNKVFETARSYKLAIDIHKAVKGLTPEQKKVYILSREKGLKMPEIAEELALSPNNVRTILSSSLEFVYDYLQDKGYSF